MKLTHLRDLPNFVVKSINLHPNFGLVLLDLFNFVKINLGFQSHKRLNNMLHQ